MNHPVNTSDIDEVMNTPALTTPQANQVQVITTAPAAVTPASDFVAMSQMAAYICRAEILPPHYRNKPESTFIMLSTAQHLGISWLQMMQNSYVVSGKLGLSSQLAIALVNTRGPFDGPIQWDFSGGSDEEGFTCTAWAIHRKTKQRLSVDLTAKTVKGEGWNRNPKWQTMGKQMYRYRSALFLIRAYCPEVLMGFPTTEELEDITPNRAEAAPVEESELPPEETTI